MSFLKRAISHYRATVSILVVILMLGVMARAVISVDLNPDVTAPFVIVNVYHQGISAEDANRLLVKPIEKELKSLDGIQELTSGASEGGAYTVVEFDIDVDIDVAVADVREAVDRAKAEFPEDTEEPKVKELSAAPEPMLVITFTGEGVSEREMFSAVKTVQQGIEGVSDVLETTLAGNREEIVEVVLNPSRMAHYNITADELLRAVRTNNLLVPSGEYDAANGRFSVKVPGLIETYRDVQSLPLKAHRESVITLADVAEVRRTFKDPESFSHMNGRPSMAIEVYKRSAANAIKTADAVKQKVAEMRPLIPRMVTIQYVFDASDFALQMVNELEGNILSAIFLVMVVVVAALGLRSAFLVGLGIPFSLLGGTIIVYLLGYSFNFMVIFGLLLALGMLIDGAIVVVEYAEQEQAKGHAVEQAYLTAVRRMFLPVVASTATTLAVFLPLMLWPGVIGQFMAYLPITVFAVLTWSLLYALLFVPVLGVLVGDKTRYRHVVQNTEPQVGVIGRTYGGVLNGILKYPLFVFLSAVMILIGVFVIYGKYGHGVSFFVDTEDRYASVSVRAQGNLTLAEKEALAAEVEARVLAVEHVHAVYAGSNSGGVGGNSSTAKDQIGYLLVELTDATDRTAKSQDIYAEVRKKTADMPGIIVEVNVIKGGPPTGKDIQIQLSSNDREAMRYEARRLLHHMKYDVDGLLDIDDSLPLSGIEWELVIDRSRAAMAGLDTLQIGNMVQMVTNGIKVGEFRPDDSKEEVDIRVRYPAEDRGVFALDNLRVTTPKGAIPVSTFLTRQAKPKVDSIKRVDQIEVIRIKANTAEGILPDDKVKEISRWLEQANINPAVTIVFRGANEEQTDSIAFLGKAFLLALFLMLILMVMQFNSFYQAFLILSAVVMSSAGVLLGLLFMGQSLSVLMSGIGIVALAGIVVNNNIVLIDTYNSLCKEQPHLSRLAAAREAAVNRLRPVLLTTITTAVGLMPLACGVSLDFVNRQILVSGELASWWQQLAAAIVNGLLFSTLLTLVVTPAMLLLPYQICGFFNKKQPVAPSEPQM